MTEEKEIIIDQLEECSRCHSLVDKTIMFNKRDFFNRIKKVKWCANCINEHNRKIHDKRVLNEPK